MQLTLQFDEALSDTLSLEQIHLDNIFPEIGLEQQKDEFCKCILDLLQSNILCDEPKQTAQILFHSKCMAVDNNIIFNLWFTVSGKQIVGIHKTNGHA